MGLQLPAEVQQRLESFAHLRAATRALLDQLCVQEQPEISPATRDACRTVLVDGAARLEASIDLALVIVAVWAERRANDASVADAVTEPARLFVALHEAVMKDLEARVSRSNAHPPPEEIVADQRPAALPTSKKSARA